MPKPDIIAAFSQTYAEARAKFLAAAKARGLAVESHVHPSARGVDGEELAVDCFEMRDRSWSVRRDKGPVRAGYDYGVVDESHAFQAMSFWAGDHYALVGGYLLEDGKLSELVTGRRTVERERGRPVRVVIEGEDALGRPLHAVGDCVNRFAFWFSCVLKHSRYPLNVAVPAIRNAKEFVHGRVPTARRHPRSSNCPSRSAGA